MLLIVSLNEIYMIRFDRKTFKIIVIIFLFYLLTSGITNGQDKIQLIVRGDDLGMSPAD
jgi:hypothetical protein